MSWSKRVKHPSKIVNPGDIVDVEVLAYRSQGQTHQPRHETGSGKSLGTLATVIRWERACMAGAQSD
jgi:hypothetical protein